jgi:isochorismate pyruvate lyase
MAELRAEIDRIDAAIVALLAERSRYIDRASEIKPVLGLPARIEDRVEDVVAKVSARAMAEGLDPDLVEDLWRRLINWSIAREEKVMGPDL